ncbi:MAG TPA: hypothetical protein VNE00_31015 [Paraburkholderia sp.]|jgi:hypothetical protein|nr:hypothetical protein [Paraburkholderia sp.]
MSPFCLIDVARIRDHDAAHAALREMRWHARLGAWLAKWMPARQR